MSRLPKAIAFCVVAFLACTNSAGTDDDDASGSPASSSTSSSGGSSSAAGSSGAASSSGSSAASASTAASTSHSSSGGSTGGGLSIGAQNDGLDLQRDGASTNRAATTPAHPGRVYALVTRNPGGNAVTELYRRDGSSAWQLASTLPARPVVSLVAHPTVPQRVFVHCLAVANDANPPCRGLLQNDSGGQGPFVPVSGASGADFPSLMVPGHDADTLWAYAGTELRVFDGTSWTSTRWAQSSPCAGATGQTCQVRSVVALPVQSAGQDEMLFCAGGRGVYTYRRGGQVFEARNSGLGASPDCVSLTQAPDNPAALHVVTPTGVFRSTNRGQTWQPLQLPSGAPLDEAKVFPLSEARGALFFSSVAGFTRLWWWSGDAGVTWQAVDESMGANTLALAQDVVVDHGNPVGVWVVSGTLGMHRVNNAVR